MKRAIAFLSSISILVATSEATAASICDQKCLSYCAYYYPSESCVEKCQCPEYAKKQNYYPEKISRMMAEQYTATVPATIITSSKTNSTTTGQQATTIGSLATTTPTEGRNTTVTTTTGPISSTSTAIAPTNTGTNTAGTGSSATNQT